VTEKANHFLYQLLGFASAKSHFGCNEDEYLWCDISIRGNRVSRVWHLVTGSRVEGKNPLKGVTTPEAHVGINMYNSTRTDFALYTLQGKL